MLLSPHMALPRRPFWLSLVLSLAVLAILAALLTSRKSPRQLYAAQIASPDAALPVTAYEALQSDHRIFSEVAAYAPLPEKVIASARGRTASVAGEMVSGNYFSLLRVRMLEGGPFDVDDVERHMPVAVLSLGLWTTLFHRDPGAIGQVVYIDGVPLAIFGVATEGFSGLDSAHPADFWIPLRKNSPGVSVVMQLASGANPEAASREASRLSHTALTLVPVPPVTGTR